MSSFFENFWAQVLGGLVGAAVLAILSFWKRPNWWRWTKARDLPPAEGTHFTVLVAELEDDAADRKQTKHVINSLRSHFGVHSESHAFEVRDYPKRLQEGVAGNVAERDRASEQRGKAWLNKQNADLLIWGEVAEANKVIRLRFLPRDGRGTAPQSYQLTQVLELPTEFKSNLADAIAALAILAARPAFDQSRPLMRILEPILPRLQNLADHGSGNFSPPVYGSICNAAGTAFAVFGDQSGKPEWLGHSTAAFQSALYVYTRKDMPAQWAGTQNNLGNALMTLGARGEGEAAVIALNGAVKAYEAALEVYTRKDMPADWAMTQNNLGAALQTLGERGEGKAAVSALNGAVKAYEAALEVYTRKDMPADWAGTQNNLGIALQTLGALREAQAAFADALTVFNQPGMEYYRAKCQASYGRVTAMLSKMDSGQ